MQILSALLSLGGFALQSLTAAILQNRSIEKLSDQIQVMLVPPGGGGLILDLGSILPQTPTPAP